MDGIISIYLGINGLQQADSIGPKLICNIGDRPQQRPGARCKRRGSSREGQIDRGRIYALQYTWDLMAHEARNLAISISLLGKLGRAKRLCAVWQTACAVQQERWLRAKAAVSQPPSISAPCA